VARELRPLRRHARASFRSSANPNSPVLALSTQLTTETIALVGGLVLAVSTFAGLLGVRYALRVDAGRALEG